MADRKGMEGKMREMFEVFFTVISQNYSRWTEEDHKVSRLV
jgi:hypothetical protein